MAKTLLKNIWNISILDTNKNPSRQTLKGYFLTFWRRKRDLNPRRIGYDLWKLISFCDTFVANIVLIYDYKEEP